MPSKRSRRSDTASYESFTTAAEKPPVPPPPPLPAEKPHSIHFSWHLGSRKRPNRRRGGSEPAPQQPLPKIIEPTAAKEAREATRNEPSHRRDRSLLKADVEEAEAARRALSIRREVSENSMRLQDEAEKKRVRREEQSAQMAVRRQCEEKQERFALERRRRDEEESWSGRVGRITIRGTSFGFDPDAGLLRGGTGRGRGAGRGDDRVASEDGAGLGGPIAVAPPAPASTERGDEEEEERKKIRADRWGVEAGGPGRIAGFVGSDVHHAHHAHQHHQHRDYRGDREDREDREDRGMSGRRAGW